MVVLCQAWTEQDQTGKARKQEDSWENAKGLNQARNSVRCAAGECVSGAPEGGAAEEWVSSRTFSSRQDKNPFKYL